MRGKERLVRRFRIVMEYDGCSFHGWQRQPVLLTVQGELEKALSLIAASHVDVHGSGRTDAGVHALAQVAHFDMDTRMNGVLLKKALNCLLPPGIVIHNCMEVGPAFHARFGARAKTYRYRILNRALRSALGRTHVWHVWQPLNRSAMDRAAALLTGTHDFKSFEGAGSPRSSTVRTLFHAAFDDEPANPGVFAFEVTANGFLRYMVRNLVGTLVQVGMGKIREESIPEILAGKSRHLAGITAPPQGLYLKAVHYDFSDDFREPAMGVRQPPGVDMGGKGRCRAWSCGRDQH
ncbi:tRNA pseudouridine(38-40) synthase TruA [Desulfobotulus sp. H1]|uniref:tRNA pseudouridine synthase A n=1 Tax=Desulfobotulus pelophilus TaxID=2823377 RepID=A0ABT3N791_9BACT|nr:tRNA pseudouridine(38-40) synthase TruA [Desulfobotulus pelophilus]MCW7753314.1 tRNA pseudouridine(38-40) synthase TruA [Desulfobotulus pelophilus]